VTDPHGHRPVLVDEVLALLDPKAGETLLDCTAGRGGHAEALGLRMGTGRIILFDLDPQNMTHARERLAHSCPTMEVLSQHGSFADAPAFLVERGIAADLVLADLGFSSSQMDDPTRGFSFREEGPLDMRLNPLQTTTAADIIARSSEAELADMIFHLGEDPYARRIARKLAHARKERPIDTTAALAQLVREAYGPRARASRMDPATRTFMALRIAVNNELGALESLLASIDREADQAMGGSRGWLKRGARIGIISFHSLEDRMVKRGFASLIRRGVAEGLTKKPVIAGDDEINSNPRARSAKLRVIRLAQGLPRPHAHDGMD